MKPAAIHPSAARRGFSLIELLVVLVLIAIMAALIIPQVQGTFEDALLRSTGRKLMDALRLTYSQSVTHRQPHRLHLDLSAGRYLIERSNRPAGEQAGFTPVRDLPGAEGPLDPRISLEVRKPDLESEPARTAGGAFIFGEQAAPPPPLHTVAFYPDGTAEAAEILLTDRHGFTLALRVHPITAQVRVLRPQPEEAP